MFADLMNESAGSKQSAVQNWSLQLNSAFDVKEFSRYIHETNTTIGDTINSYREVMVEAIKEAADGAAGSEGGSGETALAKTSNVEKVADAANKNVGQKIVNALKQLWNWLVKMFDQGINFVMTIATGNKKFIEDIKPKVVEKNLTSEDMQKIRMNSYDYKPELINISAVKSAMVAFEQTFDVGAEYTEQTREKLDKSVQEESGRTKEQRDSQLISIANKIAGSAGVSVKDDWKKYKEELYSKLYGGDKKSVKTFNMKYFDVIEDYSKHADEIKKAIDDVKTVCKSQIDKVSKSASEANESGADKSFIAGKIAFLNNARARMSQVFEMVLELLNIKLKVIKRQVWDAREFCMFANRYKKESVKNESSEVIVAFDPLFETAMGSDEASADEKGMSVTESTAEEYTF